MWLAVIMYILVSFVNGIASRSISELFLPKCGKVIKLIF